MSKKILIIGASGFIGNHLASALIKHGFNLRLHYFLNKKFPMVPDSDNCEFVEGNIADRSSLRGLFKDVDVVVNLSAAYDSAGQEVCEAVNFNGTKNILEESLSHDVQQYIHLSTTQLMGKRHDIPFDEEAPYDFEEGDFYENTKARAEEYIKKRLKGKKLKYTVLRPSIVYGPLDNNFKTVFKRIIQNKFFLIGDGSNRINFIFVADLINAILACIGNRKAENQIFIVASNDSISLKEFALLVKRIAGQKEKVFQIPKRPVQFFLGFLERSFRLIHIKCPLNQERLFIYNLNQVYSNEKYKRLVGNKAFTPMHTGVQQSLPWYRHDNWSGDDNRKTGSK